jgi:hypothetical protein
VLLNDGICTLANVFIIDPIQTNLVSCITSFHGMAMRMMTYAKKQLYHNWHPMNMFFLFVIEVFIVYTNK